MSYEKICDYSKTLYDLDLKEIISDVEYRIIVEELMNVNRDISEGSEDSIYADFCDATTLIGNSCQGCVWVQV